MKRLFFIAVVLFAGLSVNAQTYFGDVDKNGSLNIGDVQCLSDMVLGKTTTDKILGDVNRDNKVDVDDISALIAVLLDPTKAVIAYDCVDLGLSVKWATCNVGATTPEGYGDYFAWGETSSKTNYASDWSNYFDTSSFVTYNNSGGKTVLDTEDDAASVNWKSAWRMPTDAEWTELRTNCYWEWTDSYNSTGKKGYIVYKAKTDSDKNVRKTSYSAGTLSESYSLVDAHIFLPAAGYFLQETLKYAGPSYSGYYWSSTLDSSYSSRATGIQFSNSRDYSDETPRYYGRSVRPVCP